MSRQIPRPTGKPATFTSRKSLRSPLALVGVVLYSRIGILLYMATTRERQRNRIRTLRLPYLSSPQPDLLTDLLLARRSLCLFKPKYGNVETFDAFLLEFLRQCLQLPYQIN
ncbi:hypothetical protein RIF29_43365 [Crotalaria pallida]|uniref:Uncharacterized protein n=1 Tax=Crotalaria pallida TaxID=3830 RepID=A0AAN9DYZ6_CROPI